MHPVIIDVHAHYHPRRYDQYLIQHRQVVATRSYPDTDDGSHISERLSLMDAAGVGMQLLSPGSGRAPYLTDANAGIAAAEMWNESASELVTEHPERFRAFISVPLPHIDASLREIERGFDQFRMVGVNLHTTACGRSVADPAFFPIYEAINERRGTIFFHPCGNGIESPFILDHGFEFSVGTAMEDAVIVLHLIAQRIPALFPNIRFIIPHLGGPIPMLLERLDHQYPMDRHQLFERPSATAKRLYYDTVAHGSEAALVCAWRAFGASQLLPGSDYPYLLDHEPYSQSMSWSDTVGIPQGDVVQVFHENAQMLFPGLTPPYSPSE